MLLRVGHADKVSEHHSPNHELAVSLTKGGSSHTYQILQTLADRDRLDDALRAYAYFRWLDDQMDEEYQNPSERIALVERQKELMAMCYRGERLEGLSQPEMLLVELIESDPAPDSGLGCYIRNMMSMMSFDAQRRWRLITHQELEQYTRWLAVGVTEYLHYFIGHDNVSPRDHTRYMGATAAHITHMMRDTVEDVAMGYFNIPREYLALHGIGPEDVHNRATTKWVERRALIARAFFRCGRTYIARVESLRCRIAGKLYSDQLESVLDVIEQDGFKLREAYPQRDGTTTALKVIDLFIKSAFVADHAVVSEPEGGTHRRVP